MKDLDRRIEDLVQTPHAGDFLVFFGDGSLTSLPPGLTQREVSTTSDGRVFQLATGSRIPILRAESRDGLVSAWLLGSPAHPDVTRERLAHWALAKITGGSAHDLAKVEGIYCAFVLDRERSTLHVVTDVLGLRPLFLRRRGTDAWLSSRVGNAWDTERFASRINMDAVRSWACLGYNATDGALTQGWRRLPAARHLRLTGDRAAESEYHQFDVTGTLRDAVELTDRMIGTVERSLVTQARHSPSCKLSLSGGFDSRLLAAIAKRQQITGLKVSVVNGSDNWRDRLAEGSTESQLARQVCQKLGLPIEVVEIDRDWLHAFGEPFLLMSDGFPITKQLIALVAGSEPLSPVINGFLGDNLMRGSWDTVQGKTEGAFTKQALVSSMQQRHSQLPLHLLDKKTAESLMDWSRSFLGKMIDDHYEAGRAFFALDFKMRQRFYMSNNFLQHLDQCEPILPFATADLVQLKLSVENGALTFETFRKGIDRHFPEIAGIPHSKELARPRTRNLRLSTFTKRQWALETLFALRRKGTLRGFDHRILLPRIAAATLDGRFEYVADTTMRFLMLEGVARRLGLALDWTS